MAFLLNQGKLQAKPETGVGGGICCGHERIIEIMVGVKLQFKPVAQNIISTQTRSEHSLT